MHLLVSSVTVVSHIYHLMLRIKFFCIFQALGCILYELCALEPPFDAQNLISLFFKIIKGEFLVSTYNETTV